MRGQHLSQRSSNVFTQLTLPITLIRTAKLID
jgi:hypothetical protein